MPSSDSGSLPNPSFSLTPLTARELLKVTLATLSLVAPMRFLVIWFLLLVGWFLTKSLDRKVRWEFTLLKFLIRFGVRVILFFAGFYWIPVHGEWDSRARIIVSTHHSIWDSLLLIYQVGASQAAKAELFKVPIMRDFLLALSSFPVDRHSRKGRHEAINAIKQRALNPELPPLVVFPTASCTNCRQLMGFKRGAFEAGVAVQAVGIAYLAPDYDMKLSRWVLWDMYRTLCQAVNFASLTFLPIRFPSEEERHSPSVWAENVRLEMSRFLGMLLSPYSLEMEIIRTKCRDRGIPFNETKLLISRRSGFLDLDSILDEFVLLDRDGDGFLSWDDLKGRLVHRNKFYKMVSEIKIKVPAPNKCPENTDAWTERGCLGLLTGGRPRLRARPEDLDFPAAIEVVEILMYLENNHTFSNISSLFTE